MNTGQRLAQLSGLSGVSAAQHLLTIRKSGTNAGEMLVSRSALSTGMAIEHLASDGTDGAVGVTLYWNFAHQRGRR